MAQMFVTGGAGFIGANVARYYLDRGWRVVVYDNLARPGCIENIQWLRAHRGEGELRVLVGDVRMPDETCRRELEQSDVLCHLAAQVAVTTSLKDPAYDFGVNALGTFRFLEMVRQSEEKTPLVLYASTNKVYGGLGGRCVRHDGEGYQDVQYPDGVDERQPLDFHSPYGCSKGAADQYVRDYARVYGIPAVVFRQSCIYGYRQFGLEDQGWVAWFVIAAMLGRPITVYGDGHQVRDVLFIEDLVRCYDQAIANEDAVSGRIFNVGGGPGNAVSLRAVLEHIRERLAPELDVTYADWREGDQAVYVSNVEQAARELAWRPQVGWEDGVDRLIEWAQRERTMLERLFPARPVEARRAQAQDVAG